jgi:glutamyl/glutaminyl-tRNA synthetase
MDARLRPTGRLAPTPSGELHLGNLVAFAAAWLSARSRGGRVLLRIEDIDRERSRPAIAQRQRDDLRWMGLDWDAETPAQSTRDYTPWLAHLAAHTYRCRCTRAVIKSAGGHPADCRAASHTEGAVRFALSHSHLRFEDLRFGAVQAERGDDPVLVRRDGAPSYNLAVVADDITDGVTEVVRGADLLEHTAVQLELWEALGATPPVWMHSPLIVGPDGRKLSKSHGAISLAGLRALGWSSEQLWAAVLPWLGMAAASRPDPSAFRADAGPRGPIRLTAPAGGPADGLCWSVD